MPAPCSCAYSGLPDFLNATRSSRNSCSLAQPTLSPCGRITTALIRLSVAANRKDDQKSRTVTGACCSKNGRGTSMGAASGRSPSRLSNRTELPAIVGACLEDASLAIASRKITPHNAANTRPTSTPNRNFFITPVLSTRRVTEVPGATTLHAAFQFADRHGETKWFVSAFQESVVHTMSVWPVRRILTSPPDPRASNGWHNLNRNCYRRPTLPCR